MQSYIGLVSYETFDMIINRPKLRQRGVAIKIACCSGSRSPLRLDLVHVALALGFGFGFGLGFDSVEHVDGDIDPGAATAAQRSHHVVCGLDLPLRLAVAAHSSKHAGTQTKTQQWSVEMLNPSAGGCTGVGCRDAGHDQQRS